MPDKGVTAKAGTTDRLVLDHVLGLVVEKQRFCWHREPTETTPTAAE